MGATGRNITPDKIPAKSADKAALFAACDEALKAIVEILQPEYCIGSVL